MIMSSIEDLVDKQKQLQRLLSFCNRSMPQREHTLHSSFRFEQAKWGDLHKNGSLQSRQ